MKGVQKKKKKKFIGVRGKQKNRDHSPASRGKPRDVRRWSSGRISLSPPHTNDRSLYNNGTGDGWAKTI